MLALRCFTEAFSSCGEQGLLSSCSAWTSDGGVFFYCGAQALGAWGLVSAAQGLSSCGLWALGCVGFSNALLGLGSHSSWALELGPSSAMHELSCAVTSGIFSDFWSLDQTHVLCIGRWILNHCATREVLLLTFKFCDPFGIPLGIKCELSLQVYLFLIVSSLIAIWSSIMVWGLAGCP